MSNIILCGFNFPILQPLVFSNSNNYVSGDKVPVWKKLAYAIGSIPYAMCVTVIGFYFSIFLLEVVIVSEIWDQVLESGLYRATFGCRVSLNEATLGWC